MAAQFRGHTFDMAEVHRFADPAYAEGNEERARDRVDYVLDGMVEMGWLSAQERADAGFPEVEDPPRVSAVEGVEGYVAQAVREDLRDILGLEDAAIDSSGLRVTTTIEVEHQQAARAAVREFRPGGEGSDDITMALTAVRPGDGAITAMYGGDDYQQTQLNAATDARVQAGSLFKPITLVAAVQEGIDTLTTFPGPSPMDFEVDGEVTPVRNFRDISFGVLDLRVALAESVNTIYVQLNEQVGPERTVRAAVDLGLPEDTPGLGGDLTNVLGTASPTLVEINGISIKERPVEAKKQLAYIPDNPNLYEYLSGIKYLEFIADVFGIDEELRRERIEEYLQLFGLGGELGNKIGT